MKSLKLVVSRDADFMELNAGGHQANRDIARRPEVWEYDLDEQKQEVIPVQENPGADVVDQDERDTDDNLQEEFESFEDQEAEVAITPRRSERITKGIPPHRYQEITGAVVGNLQDEPLSYTEAVSGTERNQWVAAMQEELDSLAENRTWEMTELPPGRKAIGCRWIYKRKTNEHGEIVRYKARLVAQGFSQRYGLDYEEVFAPVVKQATFRILLTVASRENLIVKHVDIKTAEPQRSLMAPLANRHLGAPFFHKLT